MKRLAALVLVLLTACGQQWHSQDTVLEAGFAVTTAIDWHQTRVITRYCNEDNPILGECGQRANVDIYFPVVIALHVVASALIPHSWRTVWQGMTLGGEAGTVWSNWRDRYWEHPDYTPVPASPPSVPAIVLPQQFTTGRFPVSPLGMR